jgi:glycosyltransferase involved in cell wall biosynthesis
VHVRLVTWDDAPALGGQGVVMAAVRRAVGARGVTVTTVAGRGTHAVAHRRLTGRPHLDLALALNAAPSVLLEGDPDLVHVSGGPGGLVMLRPLPVPVVYTAHHTHRQATNRRLARPLFEALEGAGYRRAARVAAVSASTARSVVASGVAADRVEVIAPPVPSPAVSAAPSPTPLLLFVGRLEPEKGPLDAVAVMDAATAALPGARGLLAGDGSLRAEVTAAAEATGGRVRALGRVRDAELARLYAEAWVLVAPSRYEGLGLVALEAMAAGAVVAGYDVDGLRDALGDRGVLVGAADRRALAQATMALLADRPRLQALSARARRHVEAHHGEEVFGRAYVAFYRRALGDC